MKRLFLISMILLNSVIAIKAQWTGSTTIDGETWRNGNIKIGINQVDSYVMINTSTRSWWTGVGILSGDNRFVIYDATAGIHRLTIGTDGNVGIGTGTNFPAYKLDVNGTGRFGASALIGTGIAAGYYQDVNNGAYRSLNVGGNTGYYFQNYNGASTIMFVGLQGTYAGNVGIGTISPKYKLDVIGTIRASEIKVDLNGADFVFETGYKLRPLNELEKFVKEQKHLPEIETAQEMKQNGTDLGDLNSKLLQKIEELTLYIIDQNKRLDLQNQEIIELKKQGQELKVLKEDVSKLKVATN